MNTSRHFLEWIKFIAYMLRTAQHTLFSLQSFHSSDSRDRWKGKIGASNCCANVEPFLECKRFLMWRELMSPTVLIELQQNSGKTHEPFLLPESKIGSFVGNAEHMLPRQLNYFPHFVKIGRKSFDSLFYPRNKYRIYWARLSREPNVLAFRIIVTLTEKLSAYKWLKARMKDPSAVSEPLVQHGYTRNKCLKIIMPLNCLTLNDGIINGTSATPKIHPIYMKIMPTENWRATTKQWQATSCVP